MTGWVTAGLLAALGLFAGPVAVLVAGFAVALAGLAGMSAAVRANRPGRRVLLAGLRWAAGAAGSVFAVAGLVMLVGPATVPIVALAVAALVWRYRDGRPQVFTAAEPSDAMRPGVQEGSLSELSNAELGRAWRSSHSWLRRARTADELSQVCQIRRSQLDEMERRDPAGFGRWLSSGGWILGDSAPFLGS